MDLINIDIKTENKYQTFVVLCWLPSFYETFVNDLLYEKCSILLDNLKNVLKSKKLKKNFFKV